jgi:UDP-2,3-diacylglucosamine hydrolase
LSATFFVSDLHLCEMRPHTTRLFLDFLANHAPKAESLYILGDLFEYWAGDEDLDDPHHNEVISALRVLSQHGTVIRIMHGNRDLLIGQAVAKACGAELLPDPFTTQLHGRNTVLTHGDTMCTDDVEYQKFRTMVHAPAWQKTFLALPLAERKAQIVALRARSEQEKSYKDSRIMDVNADAVAVMVRSHDYPEVLIHGHTHRPARHQEVVDGRACERFVLADWDTSGNYLLCNEAGCRSVTIA